MRPIFVRPSQIWLAAEGAERFPPFLRRPAIPVMRALEQATQDQIKSLRGRAGLRVLNQPETLIEQAEFIAEQYAGEGFDRYFERHLLNLQAMLATRSAGGAANSADVLKAGGIDLLDLLKEGLLAPRRLINLRGVAGLDVISDDGGGGLRVGAMATLDQVATHSLVRQRYAALADAAAGSASPQIRSVATLGGNILQRPRCWYFRSDDHHRGLDRRAEPLGRPPGRGPDRA